MDTSALGFLGRGWAFPPAFEQDGRQVATVEADEDIRQCLRILLATRLGERVMRPDFGCNMDDLMFESMTTSLRSYMAEMVRNAIYFHEPRIDPESVEITPDSQDNGLVLIEIQYKIRASNARQNLVFPFYIKEGNK